MDNKSITNFDDVSEYSEFILLGNTWRFRLLTLDEYREYVKIIDQEEKARDYIFNYIENKEPTGPVFKDVAGKMTVKQWNKFARFILNEISGENGNS